MLGTRQVFEGGDGLLAAKVDDKEVGQGGTLLGLPVGALLQVIHLVAGVVAVLLFGIGILGGPRFARDALAVGALQIEFSNRHL